MKNLQIIDSLTFLMPLVFLYTLWKQRVFWCFRGAWKETSAMNWVAMVKLGTFYYFHKSGIPS